MRRTSLRRVETSEVRGIGDRIKTRRLARQLSIDAVAREAAVSDALVEQLERGDLASATLDSLGAIARVLDVPLLELLTDSAQAKSKDQLRVEQEREAAAFFANLPVPLRTFVEQERAAGHPVEDDALRVLAAVEFQGATPDVPEAWRRMFYAMVQGLHPR